MKIRERAVSGTKRLVSLSAWNKWKSLHPLLTVSRSFLLPVLKIILRQTRRRRRTRRRLRRKNGGFSIIIRRKLRRRLRGSCGGFSTGSTPADLQGKSQRVPLCLTLVTIKNECAYSSKSKLRFNFTCITTLVLATRFSLLAARFSIPASSFLTNGKWGAESEKRVARCGN